MTLQNPKITNKIVFILVISLLFINLPFLKAQSNTDTLKIGVVGLTHSHVHWILSRPDTGDIKIVGIVEPNKALAERYSNQYGYPMDIVFNTMEEMIATSKPEAVTAFGSIFQHLQVVETCAPLGIHVMVEKPLAVSMKHALRMKFLAQKYNIHLLTNYETTWYTSNHKTYEMVHNGDIGDLRKIVVRDGHKGPAEIGINKEFLEWLTDPIENGAGALTDFGCYGVNLITWMNKGAKPESVIALTQTIKPELYPNVDDEATILLQYPKMQAIVQASWNWPISRKDMEVYGQFGYIYSDNKSDIRYRLNENKKEIMEKFEDRQSPYDDPFSLLTAVVRNEITLTPYALSSLENNMIVVEILEAAKKSADTGKKIFIKK